MRNRNSIIARIRENDTEYDPTPQACLDAGVTHDAFRAAFDYIYCDGWYGPISVEDWNEQDGRPLPESRAECLALLGRVSDEISDYQEYETVGYETDDDGNETDEPIDELVTTANASDIRNEIFSSVREIYGSLPW